MGLFPSANDFKAGKGVEKDTPRKTGIGRFFELVGRDMNGMFLANLLACIGFLPVICLVYIGFLANSLPVMLASAVVGGILAGPALAGMYDTVLRALRDEAGYWWVTYRRAFKRNFKASIAPGIFYCVVVTMQIFLVYFCFSMLAQGTNVGVPLWVATVLNLLIFQMLFAYMWPQVVLLDQPFSLTMKNSLNCIRIWNHTQKYYESKSRQALPDGVFGHFNARKSYPFILLQNRRLEFCSKTYSKAINFRFKNHKNSKSKPFIFFADNP